MCHGCCQDPPTVTVAAGRERRRLRSFRLAGDPQGHKAAKASHPHTVQAASGTCCCWGHSSVLPRCDIQASSLLGEPPARTGHQQGAAATSLCWRRDLGSFVGTQVPGWPRTPACAGPVERRWQLGQRGGDTGRGGAVRRGCSRASGQPSVPHRQCLPGSPCSPFTQPCTVQRLSRRALRPLFAKG